METEENIVVNEEGGNRMVDTSIRECCDKIVEFINCSNKKKVECSLCNSSDLKILTLFDLFEGYGRLLFCVTFHLSDVSSVPFIDLFILDSFILSLIVNKEDYSIESTFGETKDYKRKRLLSSQLISKANIFFSEENIKIYCEQELESLFYKFYKKAEDKFVSNKETNLLLWILFKRGESNRFFRVYKNMERWDISTYKMGLLFTLEGDCLKESSQLLNEIERRLSPEDLNGSSLPNCCDIYHDELEQFFRNESENMKGFNDSEVQDNTPGLYDKKLEDCEKSEETALFKIQKHKESTSICKAYQEICNEIKTVLYGNISDFNQLKKWYDKKKNEVGWNSCLEMWSKNRTDGTGLVDEAMIAICIENKKFEQGWMIYINSIKQEGCVSKIAFLCLKALKHNGDLKWIERVSGVVRLAACKKMKNACCEITNNTVQVISNVSEEKRKIILKSLIDNIKVMCDDEEIVCCLLKAFLTLCTKCKSSGTCEMCVEYANKFYEEWKALKEKRKSFFFGGKSIWEKKIYCNMLGVCTETENCKGFYSVCCDLIRNDMEIDCETLGRLEKYHRDKHKNCQCVGTRLDTKRMGMGLIKHFLRDMK